MTTTTSAAGDALHVLRERGFVQQLSDEAGLRRASAPARSRFYAGFDPTAASLHVGSLVPIMAMAHLARAGHRPIAVLGGGTAMVGDPIGKTEMRQLLTQEAIAANRRGIEPQIRNVLGDERARFVDNAEWLLPLNYIEFLRDIGRHFSVNRMLGAEAYKLRLEKGLSFIEFNYQLLQAYDFLVLNEKYDCALQIGGDDQWGNIVAGIDLIRRVRQKESFALTFPLLTTASGAKMGKTAAGAVWLDAARTTPYDFYQYFVNVDDRDVIRFMKLLTFIPMDEIARYGELQGAELRDAKRALARGVTEVVHGAAAAGEADHAASAAFGGAGARTRRCRPTRSPSPTARSRSSTCSPPPAWPPRRAPRAAWSSRAACASAIARSRRSTRSSAPPTSARHAAARGEEEHPPHRLRPAALTNAGLQTVPKPSEHCSDDRWRLGQRERLASDNVVTTGTPRAPSAKAMNKRLLPLLHDCPWGVGVGHRAGGGGANQRRRRRTPSPRRSAAARCRTAVAGSSRGGFSAGRPAARILPGAPSARASGRARGSASPPGPAARRGPRPCAAARGGGACHAHAGAGDSAAGARHAPAAARAPVYPARARAGLPAGDLARHHFAAAPDRSRGADQGAPHARARRAVQHAAHAVSS